MSVAIALCFSRHVVKAKYGLYNALAIKSLGHGLDGW